MTNLDWIIAIFIGVLVAPAVLRLVRETRADSFRRRRRESTRRTEVIDGKEYTVTTEPLLIVREKRTGRIGLVMERGRESDPFQVKSEVIFQPRWIKVQFVRKTDGKAGAVSWRRFDKFEPKGTAPVDFLRRKTGFLRSESFIRYNVDFGEF